MNAPDGQFRQTRFPRGNRVDRLFLNRKVLEMYDYSKDAKAWVGKQRSTTTVASKYARMVNNTWAIFGNSSPIMSSMKRKNYLRTPLKPVLPLDGFLAINGLPDCPVWIGRYWKVTLVPLIYKSGSGETSTCIISMLSSVHLAMIRNMWASFGRTSMILVPSRGCSSAAKQHVPVSGRLVPPENGISTAAKATEGIDDVNFASHTAMIINLCLQQG
eukprot:scaffold2501_cov174-Amphora_coffeaeformis.AAC.1